MAVYTKITKSELQNYLANYKLGELISHTEILEGIDNSNFKLATTSGTYILTLFESRLEESQLPFFISLMQHLARKNFPAPVVQKMENGDTIGRLANRPAAIVSFLEGEAVENPTPTQCFNGGEALAKMHLATNDFKKFRANDLTINSPQITNLIAKTNSQANEVESGLAELIESEFNQLSNSWPKNLPAGIIHADFFKNNVFFKDEKISGVIDYYFASNDLLAYDLAIAINAWGFNKEINFQLEHAKQFINGYQSIRPLQKNEKENFNTLLRFASLRFLLTRLYDWLNVPADALVNPHNPKDFSTRLKFFKQTKIEKEILNG